MKKCLFTYKYGKSVFFLRFTQRQEIDYLDGGAMFGLWLGKPPIAWARNTCSDLAMEAMGERVLFHRIRGSSGRDCVGLCRAMMT